MRLDLYGATLRRMMRLATLGPAMPATVPISLQNAYDALKEAHFFCALSGYPVDEIIVATKGKLEGP